MSSADDVVLVNRLYEQCWQKSKGRYNKWISGKLNRSEFAFYLALNALERTLMDGALAIVDHDDRFRDPATGFTLAATAEAFESFGFPSQAAAIRELARIFPNGEVPRDPSCDTGQPVHPAKPTRTPDVPRYTRVVPVKLRTFV